MTKREAKQEACWLVAELTRAMLEGGWPHNDDHYSEADTGRVDDGLLALIGELRLRGTKRARPRRIVKRYPL